MTSASGNYAGTAERPPQKKRFGFPGGITILTIVTVLVWAATIFIPAGKYDHDADGAPKPGTFESVSSSLGFGKRLAELLLAPVNGLYGVQNKDSGLVDPDHVGQLFGSVGVVMFILAMGSFIAVSFHTRALEVAIGQLAAKVRSRGWLLIAMIMALFSLLGSTMGFSLETFGFYALFLPLLAALGYDRMTTVGMIILGSGTGAMASTVNPFAIGVASAEANVSIGDGVVLRIAIWLVATALAIAFVLRYAARVKRDPSKSMIADEEHPDGSLQDHNPAGNRSVDGPSTRERMTRVQLWSLIVTGLTFALMIYSVIPWSAIFGGSAGHTDYEMHETAAKPYWFELNWWLPELTIMFVVAALVIGVIARLGEKRLVGLIVGGAGDMLGPAAVIMLARGVAVLMTNTQTLDTVLNAMEHAVSGASSGVFALLVALINMPLAFLIPSSSGHATLAMPLLAPLADFASVPRAMAITSFQMGHGLMLLFAPTNVVVIGGLAIARVGYNRFLRFVWPLVAVLAAVVVIALLIGAAAG